MFAIHNREIFVRNRKVFSTPTHQSVPTKIGKDIWSIHTFHPFTRIRIPYALEKISAGFPSPAQDYQDKNIDLNQHLISNPISTFIVSVASLSMLNAGIDIDDELVVDRSIKPKHGDVVIAVIDNEFTVKRLMIDEQGCWLKAENPDYSHIYLREGQELEVWGVVTYVLKCLKK